MANLTDAVVKSPGIMILLEGIISMKLGIWVRAHETERCVRVGIHVRPMREIIKVTVRSVRVTSL